MGNDEKIPQDPLLEPVFEDLMKGRKSIYDIPEEAVDTKAWIGKKSSTAPDVSSPKISKVNPGKLEVHPVVQSNDQYDSIQQPVQAHKGPLMPDSPSNPDNAFQEWNYYFDKAERANYWSARTVRDGWSKLHRLIWLILSAALFLGIIGFAFFRFHR